MNDQTKNALGALGMDLNQTLARFMGNEALLLKFLGRFAEDKTYAQLKQALADGDREEAFRAAHTLKGVAGNLGLDGLFNAVSPMVEILRGIGEGDVDSMFANVTAQYELALEIIQSISA